MSRTSIRRAWQLLPRWFRRTLVITGGAVLFAIGTVFTVLPGPGIPFLIAALSLLAIEFAWAEHRLSQLRHHGAKLTGAVRDRVRRTPAVPADDPSVDEPTADERDGDAPDRSDDDTEVLCASHTAELDLDGRMWCPNCRRFTAESRRIDPSWWEQQSGFEE